MKGLLVLWVGYAAFRFAGAVLRREGLPWWSRLPGWILCALSIWLGAGGVGAYFPLWAAVAVGGLGGVIATRWNGWPVRLGTDLLIVVLAGALSVPALPVLTATTFGCVVGAVGLGLDLWAAWLSRTSASRLGIAMVGCAPLLAGGFFLGNRMGLTVTRELGVSVQALVPCFAQVGVTTQVTGQRIDLPNGGVAWLEQPAHRRAALGAVFFHGADPAGAQQKAAHILRRALLDAGFVVLSVDHPGYGKSALPGNLLDATAWDPTPNGLAAVAEMEKQIAADHLIVVGHSMGCSDALGVCQARPGLRGVVLFGAGLADVADTNAYWYGRFHRDRKIQQQLPPELVQTIRDRYHNNQRLAGALSATHPPIHFVRFSREHENVKAARDTLFAMFPGRKRAWDLEPSDHYFNTTELAGLMAGDTRAARACVRVVRGIRSELFPPGTGTP